MFELCVRMHMGFCGKMGIVLRGSGYMDLLRGSGPYGSFKGKWLYGSRRKRGGRNRNALSLRSEPSSTKLENTSLSTEVPLGFLYAASLLPPLQNGRRYISLHLRKYYTSPEVVFSAGSRKIFPYVDIFSTSCRSQVSADSG